MSADPDTPKKSNPCDSNSSSIDAVVASLAITEAGQLATRLSEEPGSSAQQVDEDDVTLWACPVCTFDNTADIPACEVCGSRRDGIASSIDPAGGFDSADDGVRAPDEFRHEVLAPPPMAGFDRFPFMSELFHPPEALVDPNEEGPVSG
jgi:hypothetical protein